MMDQNSFRDRMRTVVFWGGGATINLGMATTAMQNKVLYALSRKKPEVAYADCLGEFREKIFGDRLEAVCDLLTLLDDDPILADDSNRIPGNGYRMSGFSERQLDIIRRHGKDLGKDIDIQRNRVVMMRLRYDWAAVMRLLRLQQYDYGETESDASDTFAQKIYNLLDANISAGTGIHVFDDRDSVLSNFLDAVRLKGAKAALVMFINLMFACSWAKNRQTLDAPNAYCRFADQLVAIRAKEAANTAEPVFRTSFVSMNFDPILWWLIKNADARYNRNPIYVGEDNSPLYLGEDVDQVDETRPFTKASETPSVADKVLPESVARFVNGLGTRSSRERCLARYQTVKIFFPHGSPNLKICPCCGKTTLYQGNVLCDSSTNLLPPFFFQELAWGVEPSEAIDFVSDNYSEKAKNDAGELDYIQCRHCGRAIRMCDTEMVMQSGLKIPPSYLLQRISHNVDNAVMQATHIVLMGYRLPPDDGAWVAELQSRTTREADHDPVYCSVVGYLEGAPHKWLYADKLLANSDYQKYEMIINAWKVFGKERVRAILTGIPDVFEDENVLYEMLYPDLNKFDRVSRRL